MAIFNEETCSIKTCKVMTSGLRKAHKITWLLIAVVGTIFLFFAINELNFDSQKETQTTSTNESLSSNVAENDWIQMTLGAGKLEVILKKSLKASSSVVYALSESGERGNAIGQVSEVGIYQFDLKAPVKGILILDEIKDVELTKLNF